MSFGNTTENDIMLYIFNGTSMPNYGSGDLYASLHTADPGESGAPNTSEISYTGYARVELARDDSSDFTVSGGQVQNANPITWGEMSGGAGGTATWMALSTTSSGGSGQIIARFQLTPSISVANGVTPQVAASGMTATLD